ncbi:MAG: hypothetical protein ACTTKN_00695 [Phocaeicola sp.]|uniref:hypothetical protein n=1 Tax=Phocaeicola TaxID=909656 RepID=UPI00234F5EA5|nr:hypothetical protein [Phocaeicola oris]MCE2617610.1 hypothetical protein [Phocaeicola oris]
MNKDIITLKDIHQLRKDKLTEVREQGNKIKDAVHNIFMPQEKETGINGLMQYVSTGVAIYDGILTGLKIIRRIRGAFSVRRKK